MSWSGIQAAMAAEHQNFLAALHHPEAAQFEQLRSLLRENRDCAYGREYDFASIDSVDQYQQRLPIVDYEQLTAMIEGMLADQTALLCQQTPCCFEPTGGSSGGARLIPYTENSLAAMRRALFPWLADLLQSRPGIARGRSYWSISPALRPADATAAGVPIGMPDDAVYFGAEVAPLLPHLLAAPPSLAACRQLDAWRYLSLRYLINCRDLSLISIWSPSFLLDLMHYLEQNLSRFVDDIAAGQLSLDAASIPAQIDVADFPAQPSLAARLREAASDGSVDVMRLWPHLDTLSCWTEGSARLFLPELQQRFPKLYLQGKGLLATEGFVSLPLVAAPAPVLALRSGFYEFEDTAGGIHLGNELIPGQVYEVILSNHAGLYRYRLGDRLRCEGYFENTPLLNFIGRAGLVSDLCGEKLSEAFVLQQLGEARGFTLLVPSLESPRRYLLILDASYWSAPAAAEYALKVERGLQRNPQYQYARSIEQLSALAPLRITSPWRHYADYGHLQKRLQGDIKPPVLSPDPALADYLMSRVPASEGLAG